MKLKFNLLFLSVIILSSLRADCQLDPLTEINNAHDIHEMNIRALVTNNVYSYYNLKEYDSELKRAAFKKSSDYADKLKNMELDKKNKFYVKLKFYKGDGWWRIPTYNLKTNGYDIFLSTNLNYSPSQCPDKCYMTVSGLVLRFNQLKTFKKSSIVKGSFKEYAFLPATQEVGLSMEEDKDNVEIYFIFNIIDLKNLPYTFCNARSLKTVTLKELVADTKNLRIIIMNKDTKNIYLDKIY
ncbi:MAG: hypothetical protein IPL09_11935 [Bacteroidetes bacterium]|jgi:hypothetical protein|nr:hypothetical protein [Bacteroidota bacterium]